MKRIAILIILLITTSLFIVGCNCNKSNKNTNYISNINNIDDYIKNFNHNYPDGYKMENGTYTFNVFETFKIDSVTYKIFSNYYLDLFFPSNKLIALINSAKFIQNIEIDNNDIKIEKYTLYIINNQFYKCSYIEENNLETYGYIDEASFVFPFFDFYNYISSLNELVKTSSTNSKTIFLSNSENNLNMFIRCNESYLNASINFEENAFSSLTININSTHINNDDFMYDYTFNEFEKLYNSDEASQIVPRFSKYYYLLSKCDEYSASAYFMKTDFQHITINDFDNPSTFEGTILIKGKEDKKL